MHRSALLFHALLAVGTLAISACDQAPTGGDSGIPGDAAQRDGGPTDVRFTVRIENIATPHLFAASGTFETPVGDTGARPIGPGEAYEVELRAAPPMRLSFATMIVASNDTFLAPDGAGIALFDEDGAPIEGDVTAQLHSWNLGSEADQEPGVGADQPDRQSAPDTGADDDDAAVRLATGLPAVAEIVQVTLNHALADGVSMFTLRIENVSTDATLAPSSGGTQAVPLSPGVFVLHTAEGPLFTVGDPDRGAGLEALAEDGDPGALGTSLALDTGVTWVLSAGMLSAASPALRLFEVGAADRGDGLEAIAEDGNPGLLVSSFEGTEGAQYRAFRTPVGADAAGPIGPGEAYEQTVRVAPGQRLFLVQGIASSNDWFTSLPEAGIEVFDAEGGPLVGDITDRVAIFDLGTEIDQPIGLGVDQGGRQASAGSGEDDPDPTVRRLDAPAADSLVRVTLSTD